MEDEIYLRDLYVKILKNEGYKVDSAADGEEGYALLRVGGYDLVLLDIILPKIDGLKILDNLNTSTPPKSPNKAIVLLSNVSQDSVVAKGLGLGVRGYMVKSDYTPEQLLKEVETFLK